MHNVAQLYHRAVAQLTPSYCATVAQQPGKTGMHNVAQLYHRAVAQLTPSYCATEAQQPGKTKVITIVGFFSERYHGNTFFITWRIYYYLAVRLKLPNSSSTARRQLGDKVEEHSKFSGGLRRIV